MSRGKSKDVGSSPKRAAIYVRVSSDEQVDGYSLDAQRRAAIHHCDAQGWTVIREFRDEGKSARTDDLKKRPQFSAMLEDADQGLFDVVVVHKLDRFARNRSVAFQAFNRLGKASVGFVSIAENMDYSSPAGQLMLTMLVGLAQFYSDNLSAETRKGKAERKAQGLPNGLLPFGVKKNVDGHAVPDPENYPGLLLAFRVAAEGKSDREVADALNMDGYRTSGNRGRNPFSKDTVRRLLQNRFYLGELPDGQGGWIPGAHDPALDDELFERAQAARLANSTGVAKVRRTHRRYSLTGLAVCGHCGGRLHFHTAPNSKARFYCYQGRQASRCAQRSGMLEPIDRQLSDYLSTFDMPEDIIEQLVTLYESTSIQQNDTSQRRRQAEARLGRIKELYSWGDMTREDYQVERDRLQIEVGLLRESSDYAAVLAQAASFLSNLPAAWKVASFEQRNALARVVFQEVEITDDRVTTVLPTADFAPFFNLTEETETRRAVLAAPNRELDVLSSGSDGIRTRDLSLDRAAC